MIIESVDATENVFTSTNLWIIAFYFCVGVDAKR